MEYMLSHAVCFCSDFVVTIGIICKDEIYPVFIGKVNLIVEIHNIEVIYLSFSHGGNVQGLQRLDTILG